MKRFSLAIALVLSLPAFAQRAEQIVTVKAIPPSAPLQAGQPAIFTLELTIRDEYHINSDRPAQDFLIPTTVRFKEQPGVTIGNIVFPPAPLKKLPVSDDPMSVWEGTVNITAELTAAAGIKEQQVPVEGNVRYQACNNKTCLPPTRATFSVMVPVAASGGAALSTDLSPSQQAPALGQAPVAADTAAAVSQDAQTGDASKPVETGAMVPLAEGQASAEGTDFAEKGLVLTMVLVFFGGLALNLTPCVYPMIPITISYFGGQSQGKKGSLFLHSSIYVVGMATTYSILGSIAALTGSLFGSALQNSWVLIGIAAIMVLLSLSMFDVYELQMPGFLNRLAGSSHKGLFGTFFMGLTVGIVAAPCIGPFVLGLLTYVGNKGNALLGFTLFFILALGLGVPFLFLGVFSGSLSRMPRSGGWMIWVRTIFGFVLLGMAIYFLRPLFPSDLFYYLIFALTMLLGGIYMAWIEPTEAKTKSFLYVRNAVGLVFFAIALYLGVTGVQAHVNEVVVDKLQAMAGTEGGSAMAGAIRWQPYTEARVAAAMKEGKPVLIDFFADWCLPCKELDHQTFSTEEVIAASRDFVMLKVDLTTADDPQANALQQKYDLKGVPTLVFLRPDGTEISDLRVTGFEPKEVFLPKMQRALQSGL